MLSSVRAVQAIACANHSLQSCFSQKEFLIFFWHLNMDFILHSLVSRHSLFPRCPHKVWETVGERTPSKYHQNTPDFGTKKPLVTLFLQVSMSLFCKSPSLMVWKYQETKVSSNFLESGEQWQRIVMAVCFYLFEHFCLFPVTKSNQATAKQIPVLADREFFFSFLLSFFSF